MLQNKDYLFIMEKVIEKSIKLDILSQASEISRQNNQILQWLHKINENQMELSPAMSEKLESMKSQIKDKIKNLCSNFQTLYQIIDKKIAKIVKYLQECTNENRISEKIEEANHRVEELQTQIQELRARERMSESQTEKLKDQNALLRNQIEQLSKQPKTVRKIPDSTREFPEISFTNPKVQTQKQMNLPSIISTPFLSQQNSFSSALAYEQPQEKSTVAVYRKSDESFQGFKFRCLGQQSKSIVHKEEDHMQESNRQHRMKFLVSNLGDGHTATSIGQNSRSGDSHEKSVLSNAITKKYHI